MITTLVIVGIYVGVGIGVSLVDAYIAALEARLAQKEPLWDEDAPAAIGLGLVWPIALVIAGAWWTFKWIGRGVDDAAIAVAEDRRRRQEEDE